MGSDPRLASLPRKGWQGREAVTAPAGTGARERGTLDSLTAPAVGRCRCALLDMPGTELEKYQVKNIGFQLARMV